MSRPELAIVLVAFVLLMLLWLVWVAATRLDRLHRRVGASRAVVDAQLVRRATAAAELATSGLLDPASAMIVGEAAWTSLSCEGPEPAALTVPPDLRRLLDTSSDEPGSAARPPQPCDRGQVESDLTAALREVLRDPEEVAALRAELGGDGLLDDLAAAWYRVQLARRFHNDAVAQTRAARRGALVRLLRLAGTAPNPTTLELDDAWPEGLPMVRPRP